MISPGSQLPIRESWLDHFLAEAQPGEEVISVRWYGASPQVVLTAFCKWSKAYSLNACSVRWLSVGEFCLLARLTAAQSPSPSTTEMSAPAPTAQRLRNSLRHYVPYVDRWRVQTVHVVDAPLRAVKQALDAL